MLSAAKRLSISLGLYGPARSLHRALHPAESASFKAHRALLSEFVKPGDLVFDVGANIGKRTEAMLALGAHVIAFEPHPECAKELRAHRNPRLIVEQQAMGECVSTMDFYVDPTTAISSLVPGWGNAEKRVISVNVTTLDEQIKTHGLPMYCKIDVEGYEPEVLRGLSVPIDFISFEFAMNERGTKNLTACLERIESLGNYEANLVGMENPTLLLPNWVPVRGLVGIARPMPYYGDIYLRLVR